MPGQDIAARPANLSPGHQKIYELFRRTRGPEYADNWAANLGAPEAAAPGPREVREPLRKPEAPSKAKEATLSPPEAAERLTAGLERALSPQALAIYQRLLAVGLEVAAARRYAAGTTSVALHLPTELLAFELGISRSTLWRYTRELKAAGLVAQRGHNGGMGRFTRKTGSVWRIKLDPRSAARLRLTYEDLKHKWRNLADDVQHGRTVYLWMQQQAHARPRGGLEQSLRGEKCQRALKTLVGWALNPGKLAFEPPLGMTVRPSVDPDPYALLDAVSAPVDERPAAVEAAARAVAAHLHDDSLAFYRQLVWRLLRRLDGGEDRTAAVVNMVVRAGVDAKEGFARRPGALFTARLRDSGLLAWLREAPPLAGKGGLAGAG